MYACIYIYTYICICMYIYVYVCVYDIYMYICIYIYIYLCVCVYVGLTLSPNPRVRIPSNPEVDQTKAGFGLTPGELLGVTRLRRRRRQGRTDHVNAKRNTNTDLSIILQKLSTRSASAAQPRCFSALRSDCVV